MDTWLHMGVKQFKANIDLDDTTHRCVYDGLKLAMEAFTSTAKHEK